MNPDGLDLARGLVLLRRYLVLALVLVAVGGATGYLLADARPVDRTATSRVLVGSDAARDYNEALDGTVLSGKLMKSYAALIDTVPVVDAIRADSGIPLTEDQVRSKVSAKVETSTLLLDVSATDADPAVARALADAAARALIDRIGSLEGDVAKVVTAQVADPAVLAASDTRRVRTAATAAGALLGLLLTVLVALVRTARDRSLKRPDEVEAVLGTSVLGTLPSRRRRQSDPVVVTQPASAMAEAVRDLRTALLLGDDRPRTVVVTSPSEGEGKSVVALNLAAALGLAGERVVLVDADLRRGRVAQGLGLPAGRGVTSLVGRTQDVEDALHDWQGVMRVLPAGPAIGNPAEVLGSAFLDELLEALQDVADVVVVDAPPVLPVTDAVVLASAVDATLLVTRHGTTGRGQAAEAKRRLERVGVTLRGAVLNDVSKAAVKGYYASYPPLLVDARRPVTD